MAVLIFFSQQPRHFFPKCSYHDGNQVNNLVVSRFVVVPDLVNSFYAFFSVTKSKEHHKRGGLWIDFSFYFI